MSRYLISLELIFVWYEIHPSKQQLVALIPFLKKQIHPLFKITHILETHQFWNFLPCSTDVLIHWYHTAFSIGTLE